MEGIIFLEVRRLIKRLDRIFMLLDVKKSILGEIIIYIKIYRLRYEVEGDNFGNYISIYLSFFCKFYLIQVSQLLIFKNQSEKSILIIIK